MFEMLEYTPVPQFAVGLDKKISFWNRSCELLTGFTSETMLGTDRQWEPFYTYKRPVLADLVINNKICQLPKLYKKQDVSPSKIIPHAWEGADFFTINGRDIYIRFLAAPVKNSAGKIIGAVETLLEIGEKQRQKSQPNSISSPFSSIVGSTPAMKEFYKNIAAAAASEANVIIYGESGTGKELAAKAIHDKSNRRDKNFITINCGAIPEPLIESELFGYKKGAFSGAEKDKPGFLDLADGGTLFLDEIGEISLNMQVKLLRALEGGGFSPVGSTQIRKPDIRFIAATKKNLMDEVKRGQIREDFFYRVHILPVMLPSLRDRKEDIPLLIDHFTEKHGDKNSEISFPTNLVEKFLHYPWPGNVRELENMVLRFLTLSKADFLHESFTSPLSSEKHSDDTIDSDINLRAQVAEFEKDLILKTLDKLQWQRNATAAALKISRKTLFRKMKNHRLA